MIAWYIACSTFVIAESDPVLLRLLDDVREYAHIYLLAKQRQKGCDGLGELVSIREEFLDSVDRMLRHCTTQNYIDTFSFDIDEIAEKIEHFT